MNLIPSFIYPTKTTGPRNFNWLTQHHIASNKFRFESQAGPLHQASFHCMALPPADAQLPF